MRKEKPYPDQRLVFTSKKMSRREYENERFEVIDVKRMSENIREFIAIGGEARILDAEELAETKTAYFDPNIPYPPFEERQPKKNLSNILTEWSMTEKDLIGIKLWRRRESGRITETVEVLRFPLKNYGKTWRCWTAVPTEKQLLKWK